MRIDTRLQAAIGGLLVSSAALADCVMRDATPSELQHKARAEAALKEALPAAPANWTMKVSVREAAPSVCKDDKIGEFGIRVSAIYIYPRAKGEKDRLYAERR